MSELTITQARKRKKFRTIRDEVARCNRDWNLNLSVKQVNDLSLSIYHAAYPPKKAPVDVDYARFEDYYKSAVQRALGVIPEVSYARDRKAVKQFLAYHTKQELKDLTDVFVTSEKARVIGVSISTMLTPHTINLWKQGLLDNIRDTIKEIGKR